MGSLFQLRDFWYNSFAGEEFSPSAVTLADPDVNMLFDKIVLGSFQGILRILNPSPVQGQMMPGDVLLEKQFDEPILQLECGAFRPFQARSPGNLLVVLFPRALVFLEITAHGSDGGNGGANATSAQEDSNGISTDTAGGGDGSTTSPDAAQQRRHHHKHGSSKEKDFSSPRELGAFYDVTVHSEIYLEHTAYNFASGNFGRIDYNMVCIQSMDGLLTIADHNSVLYRSFFPPNQFLIPGPFTYCAYRDTFLTCNSSMFLLSYSYNAIVNNTIGTGDGEDSGGSGGNVYSPRTEVAASRSSNLRPLWAFNLGEDALDIAVCRLTRGLPREQADIVVLCSTVLYVLSETGVPRMIRRLDVEAASLCVYPLPEIQFDNLLVGTFNGLVQVYSDTELEWSAAVPSGAAPLHLTVATLCGVEGMILNLSSDSTLTINYLGTDPVAQRPQALDSKTATYPEIMQDLKQSEQLIQSFVEANGETGDLPLSSPSADASAKSKAKLKDEAASRAAANAAAAAAAAATAKPKLKGPPAELSISSTFGPVDAADNAAELSVTLQTMGSGVDEVSLVVQATSPLLVTPPQRVIEQVGAGSNVQLAFTVSAVQDKDLIIPSTLEVVVVAVYRGQRRQYQTVQHVALAPLPLVSRPVPPIKNTAFSVQLNTDKSPPPSLVDLFDDMAPYGSVAANVLSVHYLNGADATILVSKNAARFKLQGSTMEALWLLVSEVRRRVRRYYGEDELPFEMPDDVPVPDFLAVVDTHWAIRKEMAAAHAGLDQAAEFFRAVEKRLLARFRDRSPADATAVEVLFQESYKVLQERADLVTTAKRRLRQASAMLNCCAQLTWLCLEMKATRVAPEDAATLKALFRCSISDSNEVGWEEVTEAVLAKLLDVKTKKVAPTQLELATSTANVKKYVNMLVESIKGGRRLSAS